MTFTARLFDPGPVLNQTRMGTVFIVGEGLRFFLDKTLNTLLTQSRALRAVLSTDATAPLRSQVYPPPGTPVGATAHLWQQQGAATGTGPYTIGVDSSNMGEGGIGGGSFPLTVYGYWLYGEKTDATSRYLIGFFEFPTPWTMTVGQFATIESDWVIT